MNHPHRSRARQARIIREAERWLPILKPLSSYEAAERIAWQMSTLSEYTVRAETLAGALLAVAGLAHPDDGWQPIETAPEDTDVLVGRWDGEIGTFIQNDRFSSTHRCWVDWPKLVLADRDPTHWRPLPAPPEDAPISP